MGGGGGWGNARYVSATNQEPVLAQRGESGERVVLFLELKLLADVGIVGCPNAGKSTLISRCSAARPRVADYPFTTVEPVLGVVGGHGAEFVMMEVPGLLEGAHRGVGLGYQFLRHAERARLYIHLLDGLAEDPVADLDMLDRELEQFNPTLAMKPRVVVVNKMDVTEVKERRDAILDSIQKRAEASADGPTAGDAVYFISAVTGEGVEEMLWRVVELLRTLPKDDAATEWEEPTKALPRRRRSKSRTWTRSRVTVEDRVFVVHSEELERLVSLADTRDRRVLLQLWNEMERCGVAAQLVEAGIVAGDIIRLGRSEVAWF
jgi:GTP-binding protein